MKQRILVEGTDIHLIIHVCMAQGLEALPKGFDSKSDFEENFLINKKMMGKNDLIKSIGPAVKASEITNLGIIVDADDSAENTWQSLKEVLSKSGYKNIPAKPLANGVVLPHPLPDFPKIGIWIMPDNQQPRAIEDFFLELVSADNYHLQRAKTIVSELIAEGQNLFNDKIRSKADVHTWLAWQEEPGRPMGIAVKSKWLNAHHELAQRFATWFSRTFEF